MATQEAPIRTCPGWSGNGNDCGRGAPRVLRPGEETCKNCTDAARRAGQKTEADKAAELERRQRRLAAADRGAALVIERASAGNARPTIRSIVEELSGLFADQIESRSYGYSLHHRVSSEQAFDVLRRVAGLELEEKERW